MSRDQDKSASISEIDENLRRAYEELLNEALPPRFEALLDRLRNGDLIDEEGPEGVP